MKTVKDVMVSFPEYCEKNDTLQTAAEKMLRANVGSLPVLDENKKIVGVITDRDITLAAAAHSGKRLSEMNIQEVTNKQKVQTVTPDQDLQSALKIMRTKKVGRLPVVDNDQKLKGIVSLNHIVRQVSGSTDEAEIAHEGSENVLKTINSFSSRSVPVEF